MRVLLWLRRALCAHRFPIADIRRVSPDRVECACSKCGYVGRAEYGIALKGRLT
jgi:hypothetical protein